MLKNRDITESVFVGDIEKITLDNENYREVLFTTSTQQLVIMSLLPNEEIGEEVHSDTTQFIRIEKGVCDAILNGKVFHMKENDALVIPPKTVHNIINTSATEKLKLYTIYAPPEHPQKTIQPTKPNKEHNGGSQLYANLYMKSRFDYFALKI